MEDNKLQNEMIEKIKKQTEDFDEASFIENIVNDNVVEFTFNQEKYRASKPSFKIKQDVNKKRIEKFNELLKDGTQMFEKQLIESYKAKGINLDEYEQKISNLENVRNEHLLKLGKFISEKKEKDELASLKEEIRKLNAEIKELMIMKNLYLDSSIETQLQIFVNTHLAFHIIEKKDAEDKWIKPWKDYDEFLNEDENLINTFVWYTLIISRNEFS